MYPWINSNFIVNVSRCIKGGNLNTLQSLQAAQKIVHYCLTRQLRNLPATWIESAKKTKKTKDIMIMVFILLQWVPPKCEFSFFAPMFYRTMISILPPPQALFAYQNSRCTQGVCKAVRARKKEWGRGEDTNSYFHRSISYA